MAEQSGYLTGSLVLLLMSTVEGVGLGAACGKRNPACDALLDCVSSICECAPHLQQIDGLCVESGTLDSGTLSGSVRTVIVDDTGHRLGAIPAKFGDYFEDYDEFTANFAFPDPINHCTGSSNDLTGKIAVVNRGDCNFETKCVRAEYSGAVAVIILQVENVGALSAMYPNGAYTEESCNIPIVLLKNKAESDWLRSTLQSNPTPQLTIARNGVNLGGSCKFAYECMGYPHAHICKGGTCICNKPYFIPGADDLSRDICVQDETTDMDNLSGRDSRPPTVLEHGQTGCSDEFNKICANFPVLECMSDTCRCTVGTTWGGTTCVKNAIQTTGRLVETSTEGHVAITSEAELTSTHSSPTTAAAASANPSQAGRTSVDVNNQECVFFSRMLNPVPDASTKVTNTSVSPGRKECAITCYGLNSCLSFYFNTDNDSCILHDANTPLWSLDAQHGWLFYRFGGNV